MMSHIGRFGRIAAVVAAMLAGVSASTDASAKEQLAKNLFGAMKLPAATKPQSFGF